MRCSVGLSVVLLASTSSYPAVAEENAFIRQCEEEIVARLKSPSSYQRVSAFSEFTNEISGDNAKFVLPNLDCSGNPAAYDPDRDCSGQPEAVTEQSGYWRAVIVFDAGNSYGAILRHKAACQARVVRPDAVPVVAEKLKFDFIE